ncbi:hypothetical protein PanWU01x14_335540 [Parasponia andersonii]|uniref:Uncharacterized protein n=1 Tax=Parasponia andersonii TaxID=3476 RepID=A0A2P5AG60_PARAD|nr:hypothetical protein PanWU01x14_335540 [Parasponia andersonii]
MKNDNNIPNKSNYTDRGTQVSSVRLPDRTVEFLSKFRTSFFPKLKSSSFLSPLSGSSPPTRSVVTGDKTAELLR